VIEFYHAHCRTCKAVRPKFQRTCKDMSADFDFYEVRCFFYNERDFAERFGFKAFPTAIVYNEGKELMKMELLPKDFAHFNAELKHLKTDLVWPELMFEQTSVSDHGLIIPEQSLAGFSN
jgi:hypothetical protein